MVSNCELLATRWRTEAGTWRRRGQESLALMAESYADELDAALREDEQAMLTLKEAAAESGYSADHLGRLVREGRLPNAGAKRAPRIRRKDVPRKPPSASDANDLAERLLGLVSV